mgnify:CR=1 FL=1|tara:strand:+ start:75970 stop:77181 length:1212 start_codon:yes stop_codon:yes gene_type:complete
MLDQSFTEKNYLRLTKKSDPRKYKMGRNKNDYLLYHTKLINRLKELKFRLAPIKARRTSKGDMVILGPHHPITEFALRKVNDNLKRIFKIKPKSREQIVKQIITLLKEPVPFTVLKLDVEKFYENIPIEKVLEKINSNPIPSQQTKNIVNHFFNSSKAGLCRGQAISSTLSEIYMRSFDRKVSSHPKVYYYARFVDDIIIFTTDSREIIEGFASTSLPFGLKFNCKSDELKKEVTKKSDTVNVQSIEYLGYKFSTVSNKKKSVDVGIAGNKLNKIKSRVICSLKQYCIDGDFGLLKDRVRFLTGNYSISSKRRGLKAGIYYNYPLIDNNGLGKKDLKGLDVFLTKNILSKNGSLGSKLSPMLTVAKRKELLRLNFSFGFTNRKFCKFSAERIVLIRKAWKHVA